MVSVIPNLAKEVIAGNKGEFNSNDSGIGSSSPMLGFRELVSLLVPPSSPSLIGDYLDAHANSRTVALAGQGLAAANYFHAQKIDAIEERWKLTSEDLNKLNSMTIVPRQLMRGSVGAELCSSPESWLDLRTRSCLLEISLQHNLNNEDLDPHSRDSIFSPLMHVKISMSKQHRSAIRKIKQHATFLGERGMIHASRMLDETLRATLSSARSRNLGRVAARIRGRTVSPRPFFLGGELLTFDRGSMFERTMMWLEHLQGYTANYTPESQNVRYATEMAGYINVAHKTHYAYPNPPRRRRHLRPMITKPRFVSHEYGLTPFGRHAIDRGKMTPVPAIGMEERKAMLLYYAELNYRSFTEHVEYGGTFVTSWIRKTAGKIISIDLTLNPVPQIMEDMAFGDFGVTAVNMLKDTQAEYPNIPVLALHRLIGHMATFHCIYRGEAMTVECNILDRVEQHAIAHVYQGGRDVLLAIQGISTAPTWMGCAPSRDELDAYIYGPLEHDMPEIVAGLEHSVMISQRVTVPTYSTEIVFEGQQTVVYTSPSVNQYPTLQNGLAPHLPYLRSRAVAEIAMGGYWHTNMRAVCFRSYIRGHYEGETVWTGSTIGWRTSGTAFPVYVDSQINASCVKGVLVLGGLSTGDQLSGYNVNIFSSGYKVVCGGQTHTYGRAIQLPDYMSSKILTANNGSRHWLTGTTSNLIQIAYSAATGRENIPDYVARQQIVSYLEEAPPPSIF